MDLVKESERFLLFQINLVKKISRNACGEFSTEAVVLAEDILNSTPSYSRFIAYHDKMRRLFSMPDVSSVTGISFASGNEALVATLTEEYRAAGVPESVSFGELERFVGRAEASRIGDRIYAQLGEPIALFLRDLGSGRIPDPDREETSCLVGENLMTLQPGSTPFRGGRSKGLG